MRQQPRRAVSAPRAPRIPATAGIVEDYEGREVAAHPFFIGLAARPVDLGAIYVLMSNLQEGISGHFIKWLSRTIMRLDDHRITSLLAKQLNDELGDGKADQVHGVLLAHFVAGLEEWRPGGDPEQLLVAGRRLAEVGAQPFHADNISESLGALMVGEIFAKKMDSCLGDQMRRQTNVSAEALTWLIIHETLEVHHADDSHELALLIPDDPISVQAAGRGARSQWHALWDFLTDVEETVATIGAKPDQPRRAGPRAHRRRTQH